MNNLELQEKLLNFQKRLRTALTNRKFIDTGDPEIMHTLDRLLCMNETGVKPLRPFVRKDYED